MLTDGRPKHEDLSIYLPKMLFNIAAKDFDRILQKNTMQSLLLLILKSLLEIGIRFELGVGIADGNITGIGFGIIAKLPGIGFKSLPESDSESLKVDSPQVC